MRFAIALSFLVIFSVSGHPATLIVPAQYPTIQAAIDAAVDNDTVLVAPGTYVENLFIHNKTITLKSSGGPQVTVVDGSSAGPNPPLGSVVFIGGSGNQTTVDGFTLTRGTGVILLWPSAIGAGGGGAPYPRIRPSPISASRATGMGERGLHVRRGRQGLIVFEMTGGGGEGVGLSKPPDTGPPGPRPGRHHPPCDHAVTGRVGPGRITWTGWRLTSLSVRP